jgi:hypothetical protein
VITSESLNGLVQLHTLVLSNNEIHTIAAHAFHQTPFIKALYIEHNCIKSLYPNALPFYNSLTDLQVISMCYVVIILILFTVHPSQIVYHPVISYWTRVLNKL